MTVITEKGPRYGTGALCSALGFPTATYYRAALTALTALTARVAATPKAIPPPRGVPHRALPPAERQRILDVLHSPRFIDLAPAQVYASLLDEGTYHCSERTMYHVLAEKHEVRERRAQRRHPVYTAPELLATATPSTGIRASGRTRRMMSTSDSPKRARICEPKSSPPHMQPRRNDSSAGCPRPRRYPRRRGSIHPSILISEDVAQ